MQSRRVTGINGVFFLEWTTLIVADDMQFTLMDLSSHGLSLIKCGRSCRVGLLAFIRGN